MDGNPILLPSAWRRVFGLLPLLLWAAMHRSTLAWLGQSFTAAKPTNLVLLAAAAAAVIYGLGAKRSTGPVASLRFRPRPPGLALTLVSALADLAVRHLLSLPQLSIFFFVLGTFGLLSCCMTREAWRRALPAAVLLACALPFGARFGTGLGYPARVLTARLVEQVLATMGVASLSVHDIILLENGIAHVDLPCSGLKSLWTGSLFFLAATWIEGCRLGPRWLAACGVFQGLLLAANSLRVVILVLFGLVLELQRLAEVVHVPLGVFGFLSCCAAGVALLRLVPADGPAERSVRRTRTNRDVESVSPLTSPAPSPPASPRPLPPNRERGETEGGRLFGGGWGGLYNFRDVKLTTRQVGWVLVPLSLLAVAMPPLPHPSEANGGIVIDPPAGVGFEPLELTPVEKTFFAVQPGTTVRKGSFTWRSLSGSLLLVDTTSWQAHHTPELCLTAGGLAVDAVAPATLGDGFALNHLRIEDGARSAVYWFQSPERTTGSLLLRFWRDLVYGDRRWVMVSVLFDSAAGLDSHDLRALLERIHRQVDAELRPAT